MVTLLRATGLKCAALLSPLFLLADPASAQEERFVLHISVDGLNSNLMWARINNWSTFPNYRRLQNEGASTYNARTDWTFTKTLPNHASMLTGRPVLFVPGASNTVYHGYINNSNPGSNDTLHNQGNANLPYIASVFDVIHDHGLSTALYASKDKFAIFNQSYTSNTGAADVTGFDNGRDKIDRYRYRSSGSPAHGRQLQDDFLAEMVVHHYNYVFLHYRGPDTAGHANSWGSGSWDTSVRRTDTFLGEIFDLIENDPILNGNTYIILSTDHGGTGNGHSDEKDSRNYVIPFFVWGPGVEAGGDLYALNSNNRSDPGNARVNYNASPRCRAPTSMSTWTCRSHHRRIPPCWAAA
jgi:predicted AlkP superfamily pyrophosphatase or phosphodiesterase